MSREFDMEKFLNESFETRRSGSNILFNCPFCGDDSGFNYWFDVNKEWVHKKTFQKYKGLGQCFRCESRHNVLTFIMNFKKYDLIKTLNFLNGDRSLKTKDLLDILRNKDKVVISIDDLLDSFSSNMSVELPRKSVRELPKKLIEWFTKVRSYPKELLDLLDVRYCKSTEPKDFIFHDRAIFPVQTYGVQGWQAYLFNPGAVNRLGEPYPKTVNPPGTIMHSLLYLYEYSKNNNLIIVNEGIFDSLRVMSRGFYPVALFGKNLSQTQAYFLSKTKAEEICFCLDGGSKEVISALKNSIRLLDVYDGDISVMRLPDGIDPDDVSESVFLKSFAKRKLFVQTRVIFDAGRKVIGYNW